MPPPDLPRGTRRVRLQGSTYYVAGDVRAPLRDLYHTFLRLRWSLTLLVIGVGFFLPNLAFAEIYQWVGGIDGASGSFLDSLSFSVETMATIGYGAMHPVSPAAHVVVIFEAVFGIVVTALATGLVFAKFSRPTTRVAFSKVAVIRQHEGNPTLMFRVGNRRGNVIVEAQVHVVAMVTTVTPEGETFYKAIDLPLVRDRQVGMTRGWTVMHVIDERSPLHRCTGESLAKSELELFISVMGTDDTTMQSVQSIHTYTDADIRIGYRFEDTMRPLADGSFLVDLRKFDAVVPESTSRDSVRA